jgi:hypothetical protein
MNEMTHFNHLAESAASNDKQTGKAADGGSKLFSAYRLLLQNPVSSIVGNVPERPEVSSSAILGYN